MKNVLVVAEQRAGILKKTTLAAVTFAQQAAAKLGGKVQILVCGAGVQSVADQLAKYGAETVWLADAPVLGEFLAESYSELTAKVADQAQAAIVCATSSTKGKEFLPRVAVRLGAAMASDVIALEDGPSGLVFKRPMFAGNLHQWVELTTERKVVSVRATDFAPAQPQGAASPVKKVDAGINAAGMKKRFVGFEEAKSERPALVDASIVVSGGRGTKGTEGYQKTIEVLADALGAAVGATRAICDAGWVPNDWQVGQTGKIVAPDLYFAVGISGAIQHIAGMGGSKVIVAINKDPDAPIFQIADYGLVADLFQAVPELVDEIKKLKAATT
jgi:electron transfer flavoprotein alpha subunit